MRVLVINRNDFVDGGADRVFLNTYDLLQVAGCGLQVSKFTRSDAGVESSVNPRDLSFFGKLRLVKDYLYNKKVAKSLAQKILDFKPDVAHVHLIFGTLSISVLRVLKQYRVPVVMTLHDYRLICPANAMLDRHGKVCERCKGTRYYNCLIHRCSEGNLFFSAVITLEAYLRKYLYKPFKLVDHFIFVSRFTRNKHLEFEPRYALKSSHLYNMNVSVPETPVIKGDYFLFFGRLSTEKGLLTLITAAKEANVKLVIAGSGPQESELRALTCNLQPATRNPQPATCTISFAGFLSGPDLQTLIVNCSFVVVPSEWYENNPMTVVEAFSLGKPVIGSRIGGIPELVTSENGFLFEAGNPESLVEILGKAANIPMEEYEKMSSACQKFSAKNFDRIRHFEHLTGIYQQVLN